MTMKPASSATTPGSSSATTSALHPPERLAADREVVPPVDGRVDDDVGHAGLVHYQDEHEPLAWRCGPRVRAVSGSGTLFQRSVFTKAPITPPTTTPTAGNPTIATPTPKQSTSGSQAETFFEMLPMKQVSPPRWPSTDDVASSVVPDRSGDCGHVELPPRPRPLLGPAAVRHHRVQLIEQRACRCGAPVRLLLEAGHDQALECGRDR